MKKYLKWIFRITCVAVLAVALYFYPGFFGNPISKILCKNTAEKYVAENYPHCHGERWGYNFKDGNYFANIRCETSPDTNFYIYTDWLGNLRRDSYDSYVTSGHNTKNRMMLEYRELLRNAIPQEDVDYTLDIFFGDILVSGSYEKYIHDNYKDYVVYMPEEEIVLDKQYNYSDLGYKYGYVCLYVNDENVSVSRAAEILLDVKQRLDSQNLGFYYIDFVLSLPRKEDGTPNDDSREIRVEYFPWSAIYEDGLEERIKNSNDQLAAYYATLDAEKKGY